MTTTMDILNTLDATDPGGPQHLIWHLETQWRIAHEQGAAVSPSILVDGREIKTVQLLRDENGAFFINFTSEQGE